MQMLEVSVSVYVAGTVFAVPYAVLRLGMEGFGGPSDFHRAEIHYET